MNIKDITKFLLPAAVIIAGLAIAAGLYQFSECKVKGALSPEEAAEKATDFITNVALNGQATASLLEVSEESGLYKIRIKIESEEYEPYVSKDGKLLFPQGTVITEEASTKTTNAPASQEVPQTDIPRVELFVMSYCPYGNQAEELMMPVDELLGEKANIELHYVIYSNYGDSGPNYCLDKEAKYCSMHGIQELNQDVRELCVQKYQPDKLWDFIKAANSNCNYKNIDSCWGGVAKQVGVDIQQVKTCYNNEALELLAQEVELNDKYGISGSPQLIINGVEYQGSRTAEAYKRAICSAFNSPPEECSRALSSEGSTASGGCE